MQQRENKFEVCENGNETELRRPECNFPLFEQHLIFYMVFYSVRDIKSMGFICTAREP